LPSFAEAVGGLTVLGVSMAKETFNEKSERTASKGETSE
jgi:hypothetical protein